MQSFANRVVLVTGAGSGLGRQLALLFAGEDALVAAIDVNAASLAVLQGELSGKRIACAAADVTGREGLRAAVSKLADQLGPIDVLIANAGMGRETSALEFRAEDVEAQIRVNLIGVANSIDAVLPGMLARRAGQLVGISSLASYRGLPKMAGYCASKAGVNNLLDGLRVELRPHGIVVSTICPGWIRTPLTANINVPHLDLMEVDDAARRIVEAIRQRREFYAFPPAVAWRLRIVRLLPTALSDRLILRSMRGVGGK